MASPVDHGAQGDGFTPDGAAVLAAFATGEDVYLPPGARFLMDADTIQPSDGQRVYGGGTLVKNAYAASLPSGGPFDAPKFFHMLGKTGVRIEGIKLEYNGPADPRVYGATLEECIDCEIVNNDFLGQVTSAFVWKGSRGTVFSHNRSYGGFFGIATGGDAVSGQSNGPVLNTTISENYFSGAWSEAVDLNWDTQRCAVINNHLNSNNVGLGEEEIDIGGGVCRDIRVIGNIVDGGGISSGGVTLKLGAKYVTIAENTLRNFKTTTGDGIMVFYGANNISIVANDIYACYRGITVRSAGGAPSDVLIDGNKIANHTEQGIRLWGESGAPLKDMHVTNNKIDGALTGQHGLMAAHVTNLIAFGNRARRNQRGFSFGAGMTSGIVSSNNLKDNAVVALEGAATFSADSIIENNLI